MDRDFFDENFGITRGYSSTYEDGVKTGYDRFQKQIVGELYHRYGYVTLEGQLILGHPVYCWHQHLYSFYYSNIQLFNTATDSVSSNFKVTGINHYWDEHSCSVDYRRFSTFTIQPLEEIKVTIGEPADLCAIAAIYRWDG